MNNQVTVTATIDADRKKVWDYYTNPEHITQWNFADPSWHCPEAENDLRVGGKYRARMEAKDGSFGFDFEAIYSEVEPGKKLAYEMPDGRQADLVLKPINGDTEAIVTFDAETENPVEFQKGG